MDLSKITGDESLDDTIRSFCFQVAARNAALDMSEAVEGVRLDTLEKSLEFRPSVTTDDEDAVWLVSDKYVCFGWIWHRHFKQLLAASTQLVADMKGIKERDSLRAAMLHALGVTDTKIPANLQALPAIENFLRAQSLSGGVTDIQRKLGTVLERTSPASAYVPAWHQRILGFFGIAKISLTTDDLLSSYTVKQKIIDELFEDLVEIFYRDIAMSRLSGSAYLEISPLFDKGEVLMAYALKRALGSTRYRKAFRSKLTELVDEISSVVPSKPEVRR